MDGHELIGRMFVEKMFKNLITGGGAVHLTVYHPESKERFDLERSIVTYSPEMNEIVIHYATKTVQIFVDKGWESIQYSPEGDTVMFRKKEVAYELSI